MESATARLYDPAILAAIHDAFEATWSVLQAHEQSPPSQERNAELSIALRNVCGQLSAAARSLATFFRIARHRLPRGLGHILGWLAKFRFHCGPKRGVTLSGAGAGAAHDEWAAASLFFPSLRSRHRALRAAWPQIYRHPALAAGSLAAADHPSQPAAGQVAKEDGEILDL